VFDSVRPGGQGGPDIWVSSRASVESGWSAPVNPGAPINSPQGESRASLSSNGERLYFGSARPGGDGGSDIYVATRGGTTAATPTPTLSIGPPNTGNGVLVDEEGHPMAMIILVAAGTAALGLIGLRLFAGRASR
jgi:hypothetical protein